MRFGLTACAVAAMALLLVACYEDDPNRSRTESVNQRNMLFSRAEAAAPNPIPGNFPVRRALVEFTERQDLLGHPWYVYILADTGNVIGYYVAKTRPVNSCTSLSSTEDVDYDSDGGNIILTAPSLDGVFYGGSGASARCDAWFFFDSATDALIEIRGVDFYTTDQPLRLEAEPILVAAE